MEAPPVHFRYTLAQFDFADDVGIAFKTAPTGAFGKVLVGVDKLDKIHKAVKLYALGIRGRLIHYGMTSGKRPRY